MLRFSFLICGLSAAVGLSGCGQDSGPEARDGDSGVSGDGDGDNDSPDPSAGGSSGDVFPAECSDRPSPEVIVHIPQMVIDGECPLDVTLRDEIAFDIVSTMDCEAEADSCFCTSDFDEIPSDTYLFVHAARKGASHGGSMILFPQGAERSETGETDFGACNPPILGEYVATWDELNDQGWADADVSKALRSAFAAADRTGCTSDDQCQSMPIGQKGCGGPSSHVIYSTESTDVDLLEELVDDATDAQRQFLTDNEIGSNCAVVEAPDVTCSEGMCERTSDE